MTISFPKLDFAQAKEQDSFPLNAGLPHAHLHMAIHGFVFEIYKTGR
jgi:hypothetical protein